MPGDPNQNNQTELDFHLKQNLLDAYWEKGTKTMLFYQNPLKKGKGLAKEVG